MPIADHCQEESLKLETSVAPLNLLADIGGTNARFALADEAHALKNIKVLASGNYPSLADAVQDYLSQCSGALVRNAVVAIATPVLGDRVRMTNHHWSFSIEATRILLGLQTLLVINDFSALAMSLPYLQEGQLVRLDRDGQPRHGVKTVIGPGTGLGMAGLVPVAGDWQALATEGGHVDFAPSDALEVEMLKILWQDFARVSAERLVSGPGISLIYRVLCQIYNIQPKATDPARIVELATDGSCPIARQTMVTFSGFLGAVAGNLALTFGATGGVYLGGGVLGKLGDNFDISKFRERFVDKGRFRPYLEAIPNYRITAEYPALIGAARHLRQVLASRA